MNKHTAPFTLAVPVNHSDHFLGPESAKIVKNATLKVYKGAPHGMCMTHKH